MKPCREVTSGPSIYRQPIVKLDTHLTELHRIELSDGTRCYSATVPRSHHGKCHKNGAGTLRGMVCILLFILILQLIIP